MGIHELMYVYRDAGYSQYYIPQFVLLQPIFLSTFFFLLFFGLLNDEWWDGLMGWRDGGFCWRWDCEGGNGYGDGAICLCSAGVCVDTVKKLQNDLLKFM